MAESIRRADSRPSNELRELTIAYDGLSRADGSARFGFGTTPFFFSPSFSFLLNWSRSGLDKALASVSGPIEVRLAAEQPSRATFEVTVRPLSAVPGTEAKSLAVSIRTALTPSLLLAQHPRSLIQLVIQSLTPTRTTLPPSLVASIINASTVALINTGSVPMRGTICAVAVARLHTMSMPSVGYLVLDPSDTETATATASGCFAFLFAHGLGAPGNGHPTEQPDKISCESVWTTWHANGGSFTEDELVRAQELAKAGAERVRQAMKDSVRSMNAQPDQWKKALRVRSHANAEPDDDAMETS